MKRKDLIDLMEQDGWRLKRHGSSHDVYSKGNSTEIVPRHREINEKLANAIIRRWGLK